MGYTSLLSEGFMKLLVVALLASFLSASAFAAESDQIVKLLDGKGARCKTQLDLNHRAYLPTTLEAKSEASTLSIAFVLSHYQCGQSREGFGWEKALHPVDPYTDRDLYGRPITIKMSQTQATLVRAGDAGVLSAVDVENNFQQTISFATGLTDLLAPAQISALESGASVEARATFFVRGLVAVEAYNGETVNLGLRGGGAYTIFLTLQREAGGAVRVLNAKIQ